MFIIAIVQHEEMWQGLVSEQVSMGTGKTGKDWSHNGAGRGREDTEVQQRQKSPGNRLLTRERVKAKDLDRALGQPPNPTPLIYHLSGTWASGQSRSSCRLLTTSDPTQNLLHPPSKKAQSPTGGPEAGATGHLLSPSLRSLRTPVTPTSFHSCLPCLAQNPPKTGVRQSSISVAPTVLWQVAPINLALSCQAPGRPSAFDSRLQIDWGSSLRARGLTGQN